MKSCGVHRFPSKHSFTLLLHENRTKKKEILKNVWPKRNSYNAPKLHKYSTESWTQQNLVSGWFFWHKIKGQCSYHLPGSCRCNAFDHSSKPGHPLTPPHYISSAGFETIPMKNYDFRGYIWTTPQNCPCSCQVDKVAATAADLEAFKNSSAACSAGSKPGHQPAQQHTAGGKHGNTEELLKVLHMAPCPHECKKHSAAEVSTGKGRHTHILLEIGYSVTWQSHV